MNGRSPVSGLERGTVRRYCAACRTVSRVARREKKCPECGARFVLTKEAQGRWNDESYKPEVTGRKISQPWLPGMEPK